MTNDIEVVSTHEFMNGLVTVYYVRYSGGGESYEYGVELRDKDTPALLISMTEGGYGDAISAQIDGYIAIMSHLVG